MRLRLRRGRRSAASATPDPDPAVAWLRERLDAGDGAAGYDVSGWPSATWVLHAMYEAPGSPGDLSHDDLDRLAREAADPPASPGSPADQAIGEALEGAVLVGSPLGRSSHPGDGWERLSWARLARRLGEDPFAAGGFPSLRSFSYRSWPASIRPPAEGSLDREQYHRLLEILAGHTAEGAAAECFALRALVWDLASNDPRERVSSTTLRGAREGYDDPAREGSPSNLWPRDRTWLVYTDADLWGTKVSGSESLIATLEDDGELETVSLDPGGTYTRRATIRASLNVCTSPSRTRRTR